MSVKLKFPNLGNPYKSQVVGYADATYASLGDGSFQGSYMIFPWNDNGKIAPFSWQSKKLDRVKKNPLALEALALGVAADAGFLISSLVQEVFALSSLPVVLYYTDNASSYEILWSTKVISDKRLSRCG